MKKHLTQYLVEDLGYKSYRYVDEKLVSNTMNSFSSMVNGGLHVIYLRSTNDIPIIYGLHLIGYPPTLISPRPKIRVSKIEGNCVETFNEKTDDAMNICLKEELPQDIYKAMFDKTLEFRYEI